MQRKWIPRPATDKATDQCSSNIPPPGLLGGNCLHFLMISKVVLSIYTVCCVCCTIWIGTNEQLLSMWDDRISNRIGVVCIYLEKMSLWNSESSGTVIRHLAIISLTTYTQFLFKLREKSSYYKRTYGHWWGLRPARALSTEIKWLDRLFIYLSEMKYKKITKSWFWWQRPCWCPS